MSRDNQPAPGLEAPRAGLRERRKFGRRDTCLEAIIVSGAGARTRCLVINRSQGGAALRLLDAGTVPDQFLLAIMGEDTVTPCRVAHRSDDRIGVEFISLTRRASKYFAERDKKLREGIWQVHKREPIA